MMKDSVRLVLLVVLAAVFGCSRDEPANPLSAEYKDYVELHPRLTEVKIGEPKTIKELADEDVIVAVNGYPLTKADFSRQLETMAKLMMMQKDANQYVVEEKLKEEEQLQVANFVRLRLLIDDSKREKTVAPEDVFRVVNEKMAVGAKGKKKTVEQFIKSFPCDIKYVLYDLAQKEWVNALIAKKIPPLAKVDDAFVKAIQEQVAADNAAARKTNEMYRAEMSLWRTNVLAGKMTFGELAKKHSQDFDPNAEIPGYWGEFERGEMDHKGVQSAVFAMKKGEISEPLEDENGYHLVQVLSIKPQEKNEKGRVIQHEIRKLAHVYREKEPEIIRQDDEMMMKDMKRQMQLQAITAYVECLKTNGVNTIVYPHGEKFF